MTNFELIDSYLTNRLTASEKVEFDQQMASNTSFKADVELQKTIIEGIKSTRAAELKAMLKKIPIGTPVSISFSPMKIAAGIIGAGMLIGSIYYYVQPKGLGEGPNLSTSIQDSVQGNDSAENTQKFLPEEEPTLENNNAPVVSEHSKEKATVTKKADKNTSDVIQPNIQVVDPTDEMSSDDNQSETNPNEISKSFVISSHIQVETNSSNKKYNFHYQFNNGKLQLFGPFDKSIYEILEINGDNHAIFLFYRENYYLLDETQSEITKLSLIKDTELLKKLKEYRIK
jgi:hypothetical protein